MLARAGRPPAWPLDRLLAAKLILPLVAGALGLLYISGTPGSLSVLIGDRRHGRGLLPARTAAAQPRPGTQPADRAELPDTLDQMTIAVEAGLGFDSAMTRAGSNGTGPLAEELVRTLQDIQIGQTRRQAYEALALAPALPTCAGSSARSSRPTPTASRSPTCCAPRPPRCG